MKTCGISLSLVFHYDFFMNLFSVNLFNFGELHLQLMTPSMWYILTSSLFLNLRVKFINWANIFLGQVILMKSLTEWVFTIATHFIHIVLYLTSSLSNNLQTTADKVEHKGGEAICAWQQREGKTQSCPVLKKMLWIFLLFTPLGESWGTLGSYRLISRKHSKRKERKM